MPREVSTKGLAIGSRFATGWRAADDRHPELDLSKGAATLTSNRRLGWRRLRLDDVEVPSGGLPYVCAMRMVKYATPSFRSRRIDPKNCPPRLICGISRRSVESLRWLCRIFGACIAVLAASERPSDPPVLSVLCRLGLRAPRSRGSVILIGWPRIPRTTFQSSGWTCGWTVPFEGCSLAGHRPDGRPISGDPNISGRADGDRFVEDSNPVRTGGSRCPVPNGEDSPADS